jgi:hypothetical protein
MLALGIISAIALISLLIQIIKMSMEKSAQRKLDAMEDDSLIDS